MENIFITATNTDIGKTYATLKLLEIYAQEGYSVGAFKPIETGVKANRPNDATLLLNSCQKLNKNFKSITLEDICPIQLSLSAAPFVANNGKNIDFEKIKRAYKKIKEVSDIIFIEGAGGLMVPVQKDFYIIDFIDFFDAHTLLVTHDRLGCINDTLLSLKALQDRDISHSWCINHRQKTDDFEKITLPFYKAKFERVYSLQDNSDLKVLITNCHSHRKC